MFGWARKAAIDQRAKLMARMLQLIINGLRTKSYEQFVTSFSNPGGEPDALDRMDRELCFRMRVSPSVWYDATASYACQPPLVSIQGGGDDFGVFIIASTEPDDTVKVDLHVAPGLGTGRDAHAMVRALQKMPGWSSYEASEDTRII